MKNKNNKKYFIFFKFRMLLYFIILVGCKRQVQKIQQGNGKDIRPNIILIMADDMGYSDISPYGGEIETPNLERLAQQGVRFNQFYNTARCCPTRASLLTGLYPHQTGIGHMTQVPNVSGSHDLGLPGYRGFLNDQNMTIAEMLKGAGYSTYMTGKWHLGSENAEQWPLQRGFDKFYGILAGASNYFKPEYPRGISVGNDTIPISEENYYTTDAFTTNAIDFINQKEGDNPYFLYLSYTAPHWPLHALKEDIDKYRNRYKEGWQKLREERFNKMKVIGILDEKWELTSQDSEEWGSLSEDVKEEMSLRMAIYAAQVDRMDQNIGRLLETLDLRGELENTLIVFLSDNGACAEGGGLGGGPKAFLETDKGFLLSYGQFWANASNTPFRNYKHWIHEGGIATPLIVHWPKGINSEIQGKILQNYGFLPDIMTTFKEVGLAEYNIEKNGVTIPKLEGESLLPLLQGSKNPIHIAPIFWEHEGNKAVRLGKYKLVMEWKGKDQNDWELYDMEVDRTEMNNLAGKMPEKVNEMINMWEKWAKEKQVEPWDRVLGIMELK